MTLLSSLRDQYSITLPMTKDEECYANASDLDVWWNRNRQELKNWRLGERQSHQVFLILSLTKAASQNVQTKQFITNVTHIQLKFARLPQIQHKKTRPQKTTHRFSPLLWFMAPQSFFQLTNQANAKPVGPLSEDASPGPARCGVVEIRRSFRSLRPPVLLQKTYVKRLVFLENRYSICDWSSCTWLLQNL